MKLFTCQNCGQLLYFENVRCEHCGLALGYLPDLQVISALEEAGGGTFGALAAQGDTYRFCRNFEFGVCNWMVPAQGSEAFCIACRHNRTVPDISVPQNAEYWGRLEAAKHRLFYTILKLDLPLSIRTEDNDHGLAFDFLQETSESHGERVMTGHNNGLITLAVREADDAERERTRTAMGEPYRTLLGHFRHESGHYYWDVLVRDGGRLNSFRERFGDEQQDYAAAMQAYYAAGPRQDWPQSFVSAYASAHPWEDFAETWAHYLHIVDTLETARAFGVDVEVRRGPGTEMSAAIDFDPHAAASIEQLIAVWLPLCFALNSLNRSMGQADLYPFVLSPPAIGKLGFVHDLVHR